MPRVSVVIPTFRRPDLLERCLRALIDQDMALTDVEIIVADDGIQEATRTLVGQWMAHAAERGPRIHYIPVTGNHGPAAARNAGWRAAMGEIIAFTDDDCIPDPGWLRAGLAAMPPSVDAVWGRIVVPLPTTPTDYERDAAGLQRAEFATANCFCQRRELARHGGLDENFTLAWREDSDLFFSLLESDAVVRHAPEAVVVHPVRRAAWGVSVRQQRKIMFDALLYKKHPRLYRQKIRPHPRWDYYGICGSLLIAFLAPLEGHMALGVAAAGAWGLMTGRLCLLRLKTNSRSLSHILEMIVTSVLIPPLATYWRLRGAIRFRSALF